ncbi:thymidine kinase [Mythimna separata entomopoxvirus 'L']|uniref:Thymidine kinase n=1 Tax=Mythimna separata entomopoxvirus 'L' TaxID=1293572 RepID=A0A916KPY2_9POXV|nr:thymidine kinase [Mythimna separata entomopoxvirus 'L']CCU56233.1 thymidine kinase [Mythimna separata entomopoxvirus 'L']
MSIDLIIGPMYSGKTSELIRRITRYMICKKKCVVITHNLNNRYNNDELITHDGYKLIKGCLFIKTDELRKIKYAILDYDIIGVDECQFFDSDDILSFCDDYANIDKKLIIAGLSSDFNKNPFDSVIKLISVSENITKLYAICNICYENATFTMKKSNKNVLIEIGSTDLYTPLCRKCYNINNNID